MLDERQFFSEIQNSESIDSFVINAIVNKQVDIGVFSSICVQNDLRLTPWFDSNLLLQNLHDYYTSRALSFQERVELLGFFQILISYQTNIINIADSYFRNKGFPESSLVLLLQKFNKFAVRETYFLVDFIDAKFINLFFTSYENNDVSELVNDFNDPEFQLAHTDFRFFKKLINLISRLDNANAILEAYSNQNIGILEHILSSFSQKEADFILHMLDDSLVQNLCKNTDINYLQYSTEKHQKLYNLFLNKLSDVSFSQESLINFIAVNNNNNNFLGELASRSSNQDFVKFIDLLKVFQIDLEFSFYKSLPLLSSISKENIKTLVSFGYISEAKTSEFCTDLVLRYNVLLGNNFDLAKQESTVKILQKLNDASLLSQNLKYKLLKQSYHAKLLTQYFIEDCSLYVQDFFNPLARFINRTDFSLSKIDYSFRNIFDRRWNYVRSVTNLINQACAYRLHHASLKKLDISNNEVEILVGRKRKKSGLNQPAHKKVRLINTLPQEALLRIVEFLGKTPLNVKVSMAGGLLLRPALIERQIVMPRINSTPDSMPLLLSDSEDEDLGSDAKIN